MNDFYISPKVGIIHDTVLKKFNIRSFDELDTSEKQKNALDYMDRTAKKYEKMSLENLVLNQLKRDSHWFDIGQINPETKKALTRLIRKGKVEKEICLWPWITYGIIKKTLYRLV